MYQATTKPWKCVLNYHAACLLEIERGNLKWGDNFQLQGLQNTTLYAGQTLGNTNSNRNNGGSGIDLGAGNSSQRNSGGSGERVWFCRNYQKGICTFFAGSLRTIKVTLTFWSLRDIKELLYFYFKECGACSMYSRQCKWV